MLSPVDKQKALLKELDEKWTVAIKEERDLKNANVKGHVRAEKKVERAARMYEAARVKLLTLKKQRPARKRTLRSRV